MEWRFWRLRSPLREIRRNQCLRSPGIPASPRLCRSLGLVRAEVDVTVIRSWLGHASLDTTNIYARADVETKRKALEKVDGRTRPDKHTRWKREVKLLDWLDSL